MVLDHRCDAMALCPTPDAAGAYFIRGGRIPLFWCGVSHTDDTSDVCRSVTQYHSGCPQSFRLMMGSHRAAHRVQAGTTESHLRCG